MTSAASWRPSPAESRRCRNQQPSSRRPAGGRCRDGSCSALQRAAGDSVNGLSRTAAALQPRVVVVRRQAVMPGTLCRLAQPNALAAGHAEAPDSDAAAALPDSFPTVSRKPRRAMRFRPEATSSCDHDAPLRPRTRSAAFSAAPTSDSFCCLSGGADSSCRLTAFFRRSGVRRQHRSGGLRRDADSGTRLATFTVDRPTRLPPNGALLGDSRRCPFRNLELAVEARLIDHEFSAPQPGRRRPGQFLRKTKAASAPAATANSTAMMP